MLNQIFMSDAVAQATNTVNSTASQEFSFSSFVPLILIFAVFYFLIIRPQSKKQKEHQGMVDSIKSGNKIVTTGGIMGIVKSINKSENTFQIEIADNVVITIFKNHIASLVKSDKTSSSKTGVINSGSSKATKKAAQPKKK